MIPQFFLISPAIDDPLAFQPMLDKVLSTGAISVLLLRFSGESDADIKRKASAMRQRIQDAGVACLIDLPADARFVARAQLDGAHVLGLKRLGDAIEALKPERIVGIGGLKSRHDAMEAGEQDIDYILFGEPRGDGSLPPLEQTIERASWWAEIFNVPCVAYAPDIEAVAPLTATGAEFIGLGPWIFETEDPAETLAEIRRIAKEKALARQEALGET